MERSQDLRRGYLFVQEFTCFGSGETRMPGARLFKAHSMRNPPGFCRSQRLLTWGASKSIHCSALLELPNIILVSLPVHRFGADAKLFNSLFDLIPQLYLGGTVEMPCPFLGDTQAGYH